MVSIFYIIVSLALGFVAITNKSIIARAASFCILLVSVLGIWWASLGAPQNRFYPPVGSTIIKYYLMEPKAIYLWAIPKDRSIPEYIQLPWHEKVAIRLRRASKEAKKKGTSIGVKSLSVPGLFGFLKDKTRFYATSQKPLPPKHAGQ